MARFLIVGGAGFIGTNAALRCAARGDEVTILDNLSRRGTQENLKGLKERHAGIKVIRADIRSDSRILEAEAAQCDVILHLAAQVAVTLSVSDPRTDFDINALGTLNVLEAARKAPKPPIVVYSSTNKVYGGMEKVAVVEDGDRYRYRDLPHGISEEQPLDFHSPYGCSKGTADQYARDYARIYGLRTVVFRQSCIYGIHQFGMEDQGWVAWFTLRALLGQPVTIYGDGKQVRDVLYCDDLLDAFDAAIRRIDRSSGQVYNIGGGPEFALSLRDLMQVLEEAGGKRMQRSFGDWRAGDQRVYISDVRKAGRELDWRPATPPAQGIAKMREWIADHLETFRLVYRA